MSIGGVPRRPHFLAKMATGRLCSGATSPPASWLFVANVTSVLRTALQARAWTPASRPGQRLQRAGPRPASGSWRERRWPRPTAVSDHGANAIARVDGLLQRDECVAPALVARRCLPWLPPEIGVSTAPVASSSRGPGLRRLAPRWPDPRRPRTDQVAAGARAAAATRSRRACVRESRSSTAASSSSSTRRSSSSGSRSPTRSATSTRASCRSAWAAST
jgi:hypothetical protein